MQTEQKRGGKQEAIAIFSRALTNREYCTAHDLSYSLVYARAGTDPPPPRTVAGKDDDRVATRRDGQRKAGATTTRFVKGRKRVGERAWKRMNLYGRRVDALIATISRTTEVPSDRTKGHKEL